MRRVLKWLFVIVLLAGAGWVSWRWYTSTGVSTDAISMIPDDAVYCIATSDPIKSWNKIARSAAWTHLQGNDYFAAITSSANSLDSIITDNKVLFDLVGSRSLIVSAHMIGTKDYDFLFLVDLQQVSGIKFLNDYLTEFTAQGFTVRKEKYNEHDIVIVHNKSDNTNLYLSVPGSFLVASYTKKVLQSALDSSAKGPGSPPNTFANVSSSVRGDVQFYLNYTMLPKFMRAYTDAPNEYVGKLSEAMVATALGMTVEDEILRAEGYTYINDSVESYIKSLNVSGKGGTEFLEITPNRTGFCLGLGFSSFATFFDNFEKNLQEHIKEYDEYRANVAQVENYLKISVRDNIISWVGDEVALLELQSSGMGLDNETAVILKADNIEKARKELAYIGNQVRKKTPIRFKEVDHEGYTIRYLGMKGFFKVLLGKFFARYDKPYYTIINNFVVFSNHPQTLKSMIDDYLAKSTLDRSEEFKAFRRQLDDEASVMIYLNTPVLFNTIKKMADADTKSAMERNKPFIVCFRHIAFQLVPEEGRFKTIFLEQYEPVEGYTATAGQIPAEHANDEEEVTDDEELLTEVPVADLESDDGKDPMELPYIYIQNLNARQYTSYFPDSSVHYRVEVKNGFRDGSFIEYYESGKEKMTGKFKSDKRDGVWRLYSPEGKLVMRRRYDNGAVRSEKVRD